MRRNHVCWIILTACLFWTQSQVITKQNAFAQVATDNVLYDNFELPPIQSIPGAIGPRFTSKETDSAQQFVLDGSDNVNSVSLFLNRVGSPSGEVAVEIWENSSIGVPSSLVSTIGRIDLRKLSTTPEEIAFDTLVTGLTPDAKYHVVLNNLDTSIVSAQDSYRTGVLGRIDDTQSEGTNGAAFLLDSDPEVASGAWLPVRDTLGCHPTGGCPNYLRMKVTSAALLGDFDKDGTLDVEDIDELSFQVRSLTDNRSFDLNNDADLTTADHVAWVHKLANTYLGDSNLDGEFNSSDLTMVFSANEYEDNIRLNSSWAEGDWNGDGDFDSGDLIAAFRDGGYEQGERSATVAVPEPSSSLLWAIVGLGLAKRSFSRCRSA